MTHTASWCMWLAGVYGLAPYTRHTQSIDATLNKKQRRRNHSWACVAAYLLTKAVLRLVDSATMP